MSDEFDDLDREKIIEILMKTGSTREEAEEEYEKIKDSHEKSVTKLTDSPFNKAVDGGVSAHVGNMHFRLRKAIVLGVTLTFGLITTGATLVAVPVVGVAAGAVFVATTLDRLGDLFKSMSDTEFLVYEAMLEIAANTQDGKHITPQYLAAWFLRHSDAPPENIAEILDDLRAKGVVKSNGQGAGKTYSVLN